MFAQKGFQNLDGRCNLNAILLFMINNKEIDDNIRARCEYSPESSQFVMLSDTLKHAYHPRVDTDILLCLFNSMKEIQTAASSELFATLHLILTGYLSNCVAFHQLGQKVEQNIIMIRPRQSCCHIQTEIDAYFEDKRIIELSNIIYVSFGTYDFGCALSTEIGMDIYCVGDQCYQLYTSVGVDKSHAYSFVHEEQYVTSYVNGSDVDVILKGDFQQYLSKKHIFLTLMSLKKYI